MTLSTIKKRMKERFGPGARTEEVEGTLVVHMDRPDEKERARRLAEVRRGGPREDDCPLCQAMSKRPPAVVVYDEDAVLCFGQDTSGLFAMGFPRKGRGAAPAAA